MTDPRLRSCRSLLFVPASRPRAIEKARTLGADMIILDCEDAVRDEDKAVARSAALAALHAGFGDRIAAIRVNGAGTIWHAEDLQAAQSSAAQVLVLPKAESIAEVEGAAQLSGKPVLAMIESARGVLAAPEIARAAAGLLAGTNDLAADLGVAPGDGRPGLGLGLQAIVLAARAAGVAVFDGVYNRLEDDEGLAEECRQGRTFGFDGKSLIHPSQIETANRVYSPDAEELAAAQRLVEAAAGGAQRFEGRMIESLHVAQAEALLAKARRSA